jgi:2-polyprenyl-3-methyl-5-hydroxy-6-metoxy-1,4-benzoquinol methylase
MAKRKKIAVENIGMCIRTIEMDYNPKTLEELAELISDQFDVNCTVEDIEYYETITGACEENVLEYNLLDDY